MQAAEQAMAQHALELRILSGRHQGAHMPATAGMCLGTQEQADAIVSDLASTEQLLQLQLQPQYGWRLTEAQALSAEDTSPAQTLWSPLGQARQYAGIWISVAYPDQDWPAVATLLSEHAEPMPDARHEQPADPMPLTQDRADTSQAALESSAPSPTPLPMWSDQVPTEAAQHPRASKTRISVLILATLAAIAIGLFFNHTQLNQAQALPSSASAQDLLLRANAQLPALQLAIAQVDPALRLALTPLADGRIQITGWVASIEALDRLSTAMAKQKPAPLLLVRSISEMRADLQAMLPEHLKHLEFSAADSCCLRISGIVANPLSQQEAIEQIQSFLPADLALQNSIRLAQSMSEDVAGALRAEGFSDVQTQWDGQQIVASLPLSHSQRAKLEQTLLRLNQRWPGLPLKVVTQAITNPHSHAPFEIRSVVGGISPYLVLPNGSKLLPGASHAGWRLQAIEDQLIVFDQPRRITVAR